MANKKIVVAIPHSHTWFWTQTCIALLRNNPPKADGFDVDIVVVDNSPWSPAIKGIRGTALGNLPNLHVITNHKANKFHASALDCVVEKFDFDYLMALETDVLVTRPIWLQWFVNQIKETDFAVGAWHHEKFVNPSCTLYRGSALRTMLGWCRYKAPQDELRWGPEFNSIAPIDNNISAGDPALDDLKGWIAGPFSEKRGWPAGTVLKEQPSGQLKGAGHYEPGQQLYHWAVENDYTYTVCQTVTTRINEAPAQTMYGDGILDPQKRLEPDELLNTTQCYTAHMWGGTRALDILKHEVNDVGIKQLTPEWLEREARFWRHIVPADVQSQTLDLIRKHGWFYTGQGNSIEGGNQRDKDAAEYIRECYKKGGVEW